MVPSLGQSAALAKTPGKRDQVPLLRWEARKCNSFHWGHPQKYSVPSERGSPAEGPWVPSGLWVPPCPAFAQGWWLTAGCNSRSGHPSESTLISIWASYVHQHVRQVLQLFLCCAPLHNLAHITCLEYARNICLRAPFHCQSGWEWSECKEDPESLLWCATAILHLLWDTLKITSATGAKPSFFMLREWRKLFVTLRKSQMPHIGLYWLNLFTLHNWQ